MPDPLTDTTVTDAPITPDVKEPAAAPAPEVPAAFVEADSADDDDSMFLPADDDTTPAAVAAEASETLLPADAPAPAPEAVAAPTAAPEPEPATDPADAATDDIPAAQARAQALGIPANAAEVLAKAGALDEVLLSMHQKMVETAGVGDVPVADPAPTAEPAAPQAPAAAPDTAPAAAPAEVPSGAYELTLDSDDTLEPEVVEALKGMNAHYAGQMTALQGELAQLRQFRETMEQDAAVTQADRLFATMPDEYQEAYGRGGLRDLDPKSPAVAARLAFLPVLNAIERGYAAVGQHPSESDLRDIALGVLHHNAPAATPATAAAPAVPRNQQGRFVSRPTGRQGAPDDPKVAEREAAQRWHAEHNTDLDADDTFDDLLPA